MAPDRARGASGKGFTLAEVLIATTFFFLLVFLGARLVVKFVRTMYTQQRKVDAQQCVLVVVNRIREELMWSNPAMMKVLPSAFTLPSGAPARADTIVFLSARSGDNVVNYDANGNLEYSNLRAFYLDPTTNLVHYSFKAPGANAPPGQPPPPPSVILSGWTPSPQDPILSRNIMSLTLSINSTDGLLVMQVDADVNGIQTSLFGTASSMLGLPAATPTPPPPGP